MKQTECSALFVAAVRVGYEFMRDLPQSLQPWPFLREVPDDVRIAAFERLMSEVSADENGLYNCVRGVDVAAMLLQID